MANIWLFKGKYMSIQKNSAGFTSYSVWDHEINFIYSY